MRTFAIIPTKYESLSTLEALVKNLKEDKAVTRVYIINNTNEFFDYWGTDKIRTLYLPHFTVYEMWNSAWEYIKLNYPPKFNLAILNDDIVLQKSSMDIMAKFLREDDSLAIVYPDYTAAANTPSQGYYIKYTQSTFGHGGMSGFCFMIKGELPFRIDQNLKLYWGDDDLVKQVSAAGYKIGRIVGLPVEHSGSATIRKMDEGERHKIMELDRAYFNKKYSENRGPVW